MDGLTNWCDSHWLIRRCHETTAHRVKISKASQRTQHRSTISLLL